MRINTHGFEMGYPTRWFCSVCVKADQTHHRPPANNNQKQQWTHVVKENSNGINSLKLQMLYEKKILHLKTTQSFLQYISFSHCDPAEL